jgi:hypothetical protein
MAIRSSCKLPTTRVGECKSLQKKSSADLRGLACMPMMAQMATRQMADVTAVGAPPRFQSSPLSDSSSGTFLAPANHHPRCSLTFPLPQVVDDSPSAMLGLPPRGGPAPVNLPLPPLFRLISCRPQLARLTALALIPSFVRETTYWNRPYSRAAATTTNCKATIG